MGFFERSRALRAARRRIRTGDYPGRRWVGVNDWKQVVDQNGYHRCATGNGYDGWDLSCGLGPADGRYCEPNGYRGMFSA